MAGGLQRQGGKVGSNTEREDRLAGSDGREEEGEGSDRRQHAGETGGKTADGEAARRKTRRKLSSLRRQGFRQGATEYG